MCTVHSIVHNRTPSIIFSEFQQLYQNSAWSNSIIFKPAIDNISYFSKFTPSGHLLNIPNPKSFKTALRNAMFHELSQAWKNHEGGRVTFKFFPTWEPRKFPSRTCSCAADNYLIRASLRQNDTRSFKHTINPIFFPNCPHCHSTIETPSHIFLHCPYYSLHGKTMFSKINLIIPSATITINLILTDDSIRPIVLSFIRNISS